MANSYKNDVWYSTDGENWTEATASAPWSKRIGHAVVAYDGKMWLLGGGKYGVVSFEDNNDVWCSTDGSNWTKVTGSAAWAKRDGHTVVVYDNKMWLLGGEIGYTNTRYNDVWYSTDGENWTEATASAQWSKRGAHSSAVYDGKIWVIAGDNGSKLNDVWYYKGATGVKQPKECMSSQAIESFRVVPDYTKGIQISFTLPEQELTKVCVYSGLGKEVAVLYYGSCPAGVRTVMWNGESSAGAEVPAGIYFVYLDVGGKRQVKKTLLIR